MNGDSKGHMPKGAWKFDASVAECFDDMLKLSIPLYQQTLDLIADFILNRWRAEPTTALRVLSLGAGTGVGLEYLIDRLHAVVNVSQVDCVEASADMAAVLKRRLNENHRTAKSVVISISTHDLNDGFPVEYFKREYDVVMYQYTSQFVAPENRSRVFAQLPLSKSGLLFVSEKTRGESAEKEITLQMHYHAWKRRSGYTQEAIDEKAKALRNVLMPMTSSEIELMLRAEGLESMPVARYLQFETRACWRGSLINFRS